MVGLKNYKPLRLIAADQDDLQIISACLQDAVGKVGDFAYLPEKRRFAFVTNRFVWEVATHKKRGPFARVRAGLHFDDVLSVKQMHIKTDAPDAVVALLSINYAVVEDDKTATITLRFAGGGSIRLEVEAVNVQMNDMSDPWQTRSKPDHQS